MTTTEQRQAEKPHRCPEALWREVAAFGPSPALERMNNLLETVPVDLRRLGEAIRDDPGLAAEAVKLSNSSLFGLPRPVSSLEQAVVATGADIVQTLLLTCWLTRLTGRTISRHENQLFWSHSLQVAWISRRISEWTGLAQPEQAFLAGLLHDIGDLPFLSLSSKNRARGRQIGFGGVGESIELQRRHFGTDHCELGAKLSAMLGIPLPLAEVISNHHQPPATGSSFPLLPMVGAAEAIAEASSLCAKEELPGESLGAWIRDELGKWLPGLNPSASRHLVETLESDLLGNAGHPRPDGDNAWSDSLPREEAHTQAQKSSSASG